MSTFRPVWKGKWSVFFAERRAIFVRTLRINAFMILFGVLPFLPGPGLLSTPVNILYSLTQIGSFFSLLLVPIGLGWFIFTKDKSAISNKDLQVIFLFISTPVLVFLSAFYLAFPLREISRRLAMANAAKTILAIEKFKTENSNYPASLHSLKPDNLTFWRIPGC